MAKRDYYEVLGVAKNASDADLKKGCTFVGAYVDPMSGKTRQNRQIVSWPSADDERMEMWEKGADGKEWKMMEIVIHRLKK